MQRACLAVCWKARSRRSTAGQLQALGRWPVDVLICLRSNQTRCGGIPFDFMNGANAQFLFAQRPNTRFGPASVLLARLPPGAAVLRVHLRAGLTARAVADMPNMLSMGTADYRAQPRPEGWYSISLAFPMAGVTQTVLQVHIRHGWQHIRTLLYDVDSVGNAVLLTNARSA